MRTLQQIVLKLICLALLAAGVAVIVLPLHQAYELAISNLPNSEIYRTFVGILVAVVGVFGLLPLPRRKRAKKSITFPDAQGQTTIQLDTIEQRLCALISKRPEVKKLSIMIQPADDKRRVRVLADVILRKAPGGSTRDMSAELKRVIAEQGRMVLGSEELVSVDLNILDLVIDLKNDSAAVAAPAAEPEPAPKYAAPEPRTAVTPAQMPAPVRQEESFEHPAMEADLTESTEFASSEEEEAPAGDDAAGETDEEKPKKGWWR